MLARAERDHHQLTYSTRNEEVHSLSQEGLRIDLRIAVIYRPITNYYEELVGPEFHSASLGILPRHSYPDFQKRSVQIEDEIEAELRRRIHGKHIELAWVVVKSISFAPEVIDAVRAKVAAGLAAQRYALPPGSRAPAAPQTGDGF